MATSSKTKAPINLAQKEGKLTAKELADLADQWVSTQQKRLAADKVAKALKADEDACSARLIREFREQKLTGIGGKLVRVGMDPNPDNVPVISDWQKYYAYIKDNDAWEMLERRPGKLACRERWEAGEIIPGCDKFPVYKLSKQAV